MRYTLVGALLIVLLPANARADRAEELLERVMARLESIEERLGRLETAPRPRPAPAVAPSAWPKPPKAPEAPGFERLLDAARSGDPGARERLVAMRAAIDRSLGRVDSARRGREGEAVRRAAAEKRLKDLEQMSEQLQRRLRELKEEKAAVSGER